MDVLPIGTVDCTKDDFWNKDEKKYINEVVLRNKDIKTKDITFLFSRSACDKNSNWSKKYNHEMMLKYHQNILKKYRTLDPKWHNNYDMFFTPNSFKMDSKSPLQNNLFNVYCIALDIDYKDHGTGNVNVDPENYFWDCNSSALS